MVNKSQFLCADEGKYSTVKFPVSLIQLTLPGLGFFENLRAGGRG